MVPPKLLLDSHVLVWLIKGEKGIGRQARALIDQAPAIYISAATIWELNIKVALKRMTLSEVFEAKVLKTGFLELPVSFGHSRAIRDIQLPQGDPFDKLLVATASVEGLLFLTADISTLSVGLPFVIDVRK